MTRTLFLLGSLLLAACSGSPATPARPLTPEETACRQEANDAQIAVDAHRANPTNLTYTDRLNAEAEAAREAAYRDCLARRGVRRGGGVERVRRQGLFGG